MKFIKSALFIALATASAGAAAQQYYPPTTSNGAGQLILQQILQQVIGSRYTNNTRYRGTQEQEMFRQADVNRDGYLTQAEVDTYRARMGYGRYNDDRYNNDDYDDDRYGNRYNSGNDRGIPVRQVDTNRDGYISRAEAAHLIRDIQRYDRDDNYNGYPRR